MPKFAKGSAAAKRFMAQLRAMRGKKMRRNPLDPGEAGEIALRADNARALEARATQQGAHTRAAWEGGKAHAYDHVVSEYSQRRKKNPPRGVKWSKMVHGLHIEYLPVNAAWALMWHDSILSIHNSKGDAKYEMDRLLRDMTPENPSQLLVLGNPSVKGKRRNAKPNPVVVMRSKYGNVISRRTHAQTTVYPTRGYELFSEPTKVAAAKIGKGAMDPGIDIHERSLPGWLMGKRVENPGPRPKGIPPWMWNDPAFQAEVAAFRRRHGTAKRIEIVKVRVPKGFPKYMSVYGKADHAVYNAPAGSPVGKRIHHFGKRGKHKPWLVSSASRGPKFLAYVGGRFKAKPSWIYD